MMMYEGFAVSEKGYQHILNHTVCQDSTQYLQDADCVVATVADGHGSKQYFRSDRGSRFAAEIACNKIREFLKSITFPFPDSKTKKSVVTQLIHSIITEWHIAVRNDLIKSPFTPNELERVPEKYQKTFQFFTEENYRAHTESEVSDLIQKEHSHVQKAYGTTLIAVGLCKSYAIGLHIGDGKCVALYEDGTMDEPIPWDENCHLNRCTSICDKNAASEFRCHIWDNQIPVAIFLGTDGIDDTFAEMLHSFYRNVALDFLHDNFRKRTEMLQANLANISKSGSHDDVSIAGLLDVHRGRRAAEHRGSLLGRCGQIEAQSPPYLGRRRLWPGLHPHRGSARHGQPDVQAHPRSAPPRGCTGQRPPGRCRTPQGSPHPERQGGCRCIQLQKVIFVSEYPVC